ncbi:MAG TPA: murein biosynthesis integral membrane protein MurJ [Thermotogota bacterium]|nr:MAG: putative peptidoglycan biosynthesis protein MurJ [Thermotogota bacterium ADurb.Bin062]HNW46976.1 murein biosynthesis integral membrane protein MurJ [Thermotogota bacterium]HOD91806.1 murein biosynthesis integral membrane protein MurJ [Thermotogota bacterium]HPG98203.1 murein biosynthesis integral membrane protein MurJ [Thermotogota bacterium]HPN29204.1 murein biosynthesis integral membrane protein MurJ [Thermotogota bacterium]
MSKTIKFSLYMAVATLMSRVLGLVRDAMFANVFGSSPEYDAYLVAVLLPFFLRRIFGEGALQSAFVPIYNKRAMIDSRSATRFANTIFTVFVPILILCTLLGYYFMPYLIYLFAPGMEPAIREMAVMCGVVAFPFIIFISLWAIKTGILNSHDIYFVPAFSPAIHNVFTIAGILLSPYFTPRILGPTVFFLIGGAFQFISVLFIGKKKTGYRFEIDFVREDMKEFSSLFLSSMAAVSITQINSLIDTIVVSHLGQGSISLLQYANRLYQLPLGVIGVSVSTVALSQLSKRSLDSFREMVTDNLEKLLLLILPAAAGMILLREGLVVFLFQRGAFGIYETVFTSKILLGYLFGLPFYCVYFLLSKAEYALGKGNVAFFASCISVGTNVILDFTLAPIQGAYGVALATSFAGMTPVAFLLVHLIRIKGLTMTRRQLSELLKTVSATAVMSAVLLMIAKTYSYSKPLVVLELVCGVLVYLLALLLLRKQEMKRLILRWSRRG